MGDTLDAVPQNHGSSKGGVNENVYKIPEKGGKKPNMAKHPSAHGCFFVLIEGIGGNSIDVIII